jgi:hypothetical protein
MEKLIIEIASFSMRKIDKNTYKYRGSSRRRSFKFLISTLKKY